MTFNLTFSSSFNMAENTTEIFIKQTGVPVFFLSNVQQ